jgi:hypothetical protein
MTDKRRELSREVTIVHLAHDLANVERAPSEPQTFPLLNVGQPHNG